MVTAIPYGLFELDESARVVHYSSPTEKEAVRDAPKIVGRNFFEELLPVAELNNLKNRFLRFMADGDAVERFSLSFRLDGEVVKVQVALARVTEGSQGGNRRFALIRIMPETVFV